MEKEAWVGIRMKGNLDFCKKEAMSFLVCRFGFEYRILQSPSASEALDHILHPLSGLVRRSEGVGWPLSLLRGINSFSC